MPCSMQPKQYTKVLKAMLVSKAYLENVKKGIIEEEIGKSRAFDLRQKSDYEIQAEFEVEDVKELIKESEEFVNEIKRILKIE